VAKLWEQLLAAAPQSLQQQLQQSSASGRSQLLPRRATATAPAATHGTDALSVFVALERAFALTLLRQVQQDVAALQAAMRGTGQQLAPAHARAAAAHLAAGAVPPAWQGLWEGPASPLDYLRSAVRR
jgi:hypothetical protein